MTKTLAEKIEELPENRRKKVLGRAAELTWGEQTNIIRALLLKYFKGENEKEGSELPRRKVSIWLHTANPLLGNLVPRDMIYAGRFEKLHKFVTVMLEKNQEPMK